MSVMQIKFCSALFILLCFTSIKCGFGEFGTASMNTDLYTPTACYGNQVDYFPANNFVATVNEAIWNGGSMCGMRFKVACLSGINRPCKHEIITVLVVDVCKGKHCPTFLLSYDAFTAISMIKGAKIRIDFVML
ncbi:hypothetical protein LXL04_021605 [Taraxacum kok-saghyz]